MESTSTCWKSAKTSEDGWWIVVTTVQPLRASDERSVTTLHAVNESSPLVGSSRKSTAGRITSSTPIEQRFFSPPDTPRIIRSPTSVSAHASSPSSTSIVDTSACFSANGTERGNRSAALNSSASRTVCVAQRMSSCST